MARKNKLNLICQLLMLLYLSDQGSDISNIASTYSALAILKIVGYDLLNLDAESILVSMKHLQQPDGRSAFSII